MIQENTNGNTTGESVSVPLSEAAATLGITLPRLTRLLKRPEFAAGVSKSERQTRTGTRTITLVSVSVLEAVRFSLSEHKHEQYGPNHYRSGAAGSGDQLPALALQILAEREARLADKDAEIQRLMTTLTETQSALRLAQENLSREQALRSLPAPQAAQPEASNERPGDTQSAVRGVLGVSVPTSTDTGPSEAISGSASSAVVNEAVTADGNKSGNSNAGDGNMKRPWWRVWK